GLLGHVQGLAGGQAPVDISYTDRIDPTIEVGLASRSVTVASTTDRTLDLYTGYLAEDQVQVQGTLGAVNVHSARPDKVTGGNAGRLRSIMGKVTVTNTQGQATLEVDDSAEPMPQKKAVLDAVSDSPTGPRFGQVRFLAPADIVYSEAGLASLTVDGGRGGNI